MRLHGDRREGLWPILAGEGEHGTVRWAARCEARRAKRDDGELKPGSTTRRRKEKGLASHRDTSPQSLPAPKREQAYWFRLGSRCTRRSADRDRTAHSVAATSRHHLTTHTPGLTEQRKTPHAAAACGALTDLVGSRPPGPGALASYSRVGAWTTVPSLDSGRACTVVKYLRDYRCSALHRGVIRIEVSDRANTSQRPGGDPHAPVE